MGKRVNCSSNFVPQKCARKRLEADRIRELPDEIIISVLSRLTLKEAARSCVLSKRWINLWPFTARLDFYDPKALERARQNLTDIPYLKAEKVKYVNWVNQILIQHRGHILEDFNIYFFLYQTSQQDIDKWLEFALLKNVQKLKLELLSSSGHIRHSSRNYVFPTESLLNSWHVHFECLRELSLKCVNVSAEVLLLLLKKCSFLERLIVHGSPALVSPEISCLPRILKYLELAYCYNLESIIIHDANLLSLRVMTAGIPLVEKVPVLVDLFVGYIANPERCSYIFDRLSCCLPQLVSLTLCVGMSHLKNMKSYKFPELTKLKQLVLGVSIDDYGTLLGLTSLLQAAPFLKKLVVLIRKFLLHQDIVAVVDGLAADPNRRVFPYEYQEKLEDEKASRQLRKILRVVPPHVDVLII